MKVLGGGKLGRWLRCRGIVGRDGGRHAGFGSQARYGPPSPAVCWVVPGGKAYRNVAWSVTLTVLLNCHCHLSISLQWLPEKWVFAYILVLAILEAKKNSKSCQCNCINHFYSYDLRVKSFTLKYGTRSGINPQHSHSAIPILPLVFSVFSLLKTIWPHIGCGCLPL